MLKRLADAERDGDHVYAVIKGVAGSSDGKSLGLTAPRRAGQIRALERAYEHAGFAPTDVELVEAHGTGTVVGDRTELETLDDVFGLQGRAPGYCTLGSVKSQIGHTKCAAGLAGLIKTALAIERRVLPPTLNVEEPNPGWESGKSPFVLGREARPWLSATRRAGVSAFGFGGTNFHVVLEGHADSAAEAALSDWPAELFLFRGETAREAKKRAHLLAEAIGEDDSWRLRDLARTVALEEGPVHAALVAGSLDELRLGLSELADGSGSRVSWRTLPPKTRRPSPSSSRVREASESACSATCSLRSQACTDSSSLVRAGRMRSSHRRPGRPSSGMRRRRSSRTRALRSRRLA